MSKLISSRLYRVLTYYVFYLGRLGIMDKPHQLLEKYFKGQCTKEEAGIFMKWYLSKEAEEYLSQEMDGLWEDKISEDWTGKPLLALINAEKQRNHLHVSHKSDSSKHNIVHHKNWGYNSWYIVASLILLLSIITIFFLLNDRKYEQIIVKSAEIQHVIKTTPLGQKSTIFLSDGSKVILNSGSEITYYPDFSKDERFIELTGEAFFEVERDEKRPFKVKAGNTVTTALGTSFNIRSYIESDITTIGLVTGKVEVNFAEDSNKNIFLEPGEGAKYSKLKNDISKQPFDIEKCAAWRLGILYFKDDSFDSAVKTLQMWYGVNINVQGKITGSFSAKFDNQSLETVLNGLSFIFSFQYTIDGKNVIIKPI